MKPVTHKLGNISILHDADAVADFPPQFFDLDYWQESGGYEASAGQGKGHTIFVRHEHQYWTVRHYCRGGAVGWFIRDAYLWLGLERSRPWREWHLLADLSQQGLPVPVPVAARVTRHRFVYTADLVMQTIENARMWQDCMHEGSLDAADWQALGRLIRSFHDAGIFHHDLNIRNILRQEDGQLYLIDFDMARLRAGTVWKRWNLDRLHRSIAKLEKRGANLHFSEACWRQLLQGYMLAA